ncbi:type I glyceraldehyde-3-phosphate dehydrogenase [Desulfopila aestuarii]|uniref:Erythrose 4-phosphate dehydrogenase n=1 Tax=Desulfopila aestuarii DSM 18488 TaxID=1121416 RepID=A0A1M7YGK2_9BACT|nr:glyceraldehyde 3-phosphate dehydrogenase NAD-binding domain-containing protein [Desulfopila aestuarii]SHO51721.1 erythrose 4-phosphate dehydrogenase [Desulfopila aestuarii DSM 18488]
MSYRVAINGYGRIGQSVLRAIYTGPHRKDFEVVAINELADIETLTYLTRYDTTHGRFPVPVSCSEDTLYINGDRIQVLCEECPENLPWQALDIDLLFECSGSFNDRTTANLHLASGAKRILLSHPANPDMDATVVYGVNDNQLRAEHKIVSNASCTTNCIVPVLDLLDKALGLDFGVITTVHSAMNDQPVIDSYHNTNLRLTRSALHSIIPVETGLNRGIQRILPHLGDRFQCLHLRVPTINVSLMDLSVNVKTDTTAEQVNNIMREAADGHLQGLLGYTQEPHASVDFNTDPHSGIIDATQTRVSGTKLVKLVCWFDNEWGFANRMLDVGCKWLVLSAK